MAATRHDFKTPVGRLVSGSVYEPNTEDQDGNPYKDKHGNPRVDYSIGVAIPKTPGVQHWSQEAWGAPIWANGHAAWPQGQGSNRDFSWKIHDGDSQELNKAKVPRRNCDKEGWAGHWVVFFSGGFAPGLFNSDGSQRLVQPDAIKRGYWVQVFGNYCSNESTQSPGIYMNHSLVALAGYDTEIVSGPDAKSVGFGQGTALPAHVSATPVGGNFNPAPPPAAAPAPSAPPPAVPAPAPVAPPPVAVTPNPAVLAPPPAVPAPAPVAPPPAAPVAAGPVMTAKAGGFTYEQMISSGWTDAQLRENGYLA